MSTPGLHCPVASFSFRQLLRPTRLLTFIFFCIRVCLNAFRHEYLRFHEDDEDKYPYMPPKDHASRSPCPALNTMANHGYIPRSGRKLNGAVLVKGLKRAYNLSTPLAIFLAYGGIAILGQSGDVSLHDLARHNRVEHDASIAHEDTQRVFDDDGNEQESGLGQLGGELKGAVTELGKTFKEGAEAIEQKFEEITHSTPAPSRQGTLSVKVDNTSPIANGPPSATSSPPQSAASSIFLVNSPTRARHQETDSEPEIDSDHDTPKPMPVHASTAPLPPLQAVMKTQLEDLKRTDSARFDRLNSTAVPSSSPAGPSSAQHELHLSTCPQHRVSYPHPHEAHRSATLPASLPSHIAHLDVDCKEYAPHHVCPHLFSQFIDTHHKLHNASFNPSAPHDSPAVSALSVAHTRVKREHESVALHGPGCIDAVHQEIARGETALVLSIFGSYSSPTLNKLSKYPSFFAQLWQAVEVTMWNPAKNVKNGKDGAQPVPTPAVPVPYLSSFWMEERLPEGWKPERETTVLGTVVVSTVIRRYMEMIRATSPQATHS